MGNTMFFKKKKKTVEKVCIDDRLQHIAFIMDGNGRWAQKRGLPREYGHSHGAAVFKDIGRYCASIGLKYMTVYAFSTENWKRPKKEVDAIMRLLDDYIEERLQNIDEDNVHFRFVGNLTVFPDTVRAKMDELDRASAHKPFVLNIAVNYGGREEIVHACNELLREGKTEICEADIQRTLYTAGCPDPDLVVRTGGDLRISNFMLWQSAYTEYYFMDILWPDLTHAHVDEAVAAFYSRKRRYGGV